MEFEVDAKQVERITEGIGDARCAQRDAEVQAYLSLPLVERKGKPEGVTAPAVAVVGVDGGRLQIRSDTTAAAAGTEEALPAENGHRGTHWREDKIGLLMTMTSDVQASDPCPEVPRAFRNPTRIPSLTRELKTKKAAGQEAVAETPTPEVVEEVLREEGQKGKWQPPEVEEKHLTATRRPWAQFGPMVAQAAWKLGFYEAERKAFVGDGSDHVWTVWQNHFSSFVPVLDIIHAISYLFASATAGRSFDEGWPVYDRWMKWVWQGEVEKVIAELGQRQAELGMPQEGDGETHPRAIVGTALGYLQHHKDKMRYADYRRQGLPITSSYVESAVKQFNERVKGTEMFWSEAGAEALLQLRADHLSPASVLEDFWQARQDTATGLNAYQLAV